MEATKTNGDVDDAEHSRLRVLTLRTGSMACARSTHQRDGVATNGGEDQWYERQASAGEPHNTTPKAYQIKEYLCA